MKLVAATIVSLLVTAAGAGAANAQAQGAPPSASGTPGSAAAAAPQRQLKLSPKAQPAIAALQTAINAKNTVAIPGLVTAAQALAKTPDDRYAIARLQLEAAAAANDLPGVLAAADTLRSNGGGASELSGIYGAVANQAITAKQYPTASTALDRLAALDPNNTDVLVARAQIHFAQNRNAEGLGALTQAINLAKGSGRAVPSSWYQNRVAVAYNNKLPTTYGFAREWVAASPSPEHWRDAIGMYRNMAGLDQATTVDMLRLARATKSLSANDYAAWAGSLIDRGYPAEALSLLQEGEANGTIKLSSASIAPLASSARSKAPGERGVVAQLGKAALSAPDARTAMRAGDGLFDAGDYAQAATVYRAALSKSGVNKDLANLHLGMALAMSGDKAGATAALQSVGGSQAEAAKYWLTYVSMRA